MRLTKRHLVALPLLLTLASGVAFAADGVFTDTTTTTVEAAPSPTPSPSPSPEFVAADPVNEDGTGVPVAEASTAPAPTAEPSTASTYDPGTTVASDTTTTTTSDPTPRRTATLSPLEAGWTSLYEGHTGMTVVRMTEPGTYRVTYDVGDCWEDSTKPQVRFTVTGMEGVMQGGGQHEVGCQSGTLMVPPVTEYPTNLVVGGESGTTPPTWLFRVEYQPAS